jgi:carotenoid 1,2-hydratase
LRDRGWAFDSAIAPRGYRWWYIDALSDDGAYGITLIAFIGSVFSPWYRLARRGGRAVPAENHCAMNVALYGRTRRWAMTERGAAALSRDWASLQIGPSSLHWDGTVLTARIDEVTAPVPSRLRGTIRLHPPALSTHVVALDGVGRHRWSPIAPGSRVEVDLDRPQLRWQGHAYFDTNHGDEPLEEGFSEWDWCRAPTRDGVRVLYHGVRRDGAGFSTALRYDERGQAEIVEPPPPASLGRSFWGMRLKTLADAGAAPRVTQRLEDAPFYARSVIATRLGGEAVTAVHESLSLDRFVSPVVQMMLPFKAPRAMRSGTDPAKF